MGNLFSADGLLYKICNYLYVFFFANILWIIFSLPIFTIGASTTALFNVMGKLTHDEDVSVFRDFWNSYKLNFKQGIVIGSILTLLFFILYLDLTHLYLFNSKIFRFFVGSVQIFMLLELMICSTYAFYMLSKYNMTYRKLIFNSFAIGNKHLLTSFFCILIFLGIGFIWLTTPTIRTFLLFTFASIYAYGTSFFINSIMSRYVSDKKKDFKCKQFKLN
jgi:uncharacterized membrane protein YesL